MRLSATPSPPFAGRIWQLAPGLTLSLLILAMAGAGLAALVWQAEWSPGQLIASTYLRGVVGFTIWQASLSVVLSLMLAIPVARALARHPRFPGRSLLLRAMEMSLVMPTIVAVSGLVSVYGRSGWFTELVGQITGGNPWNLYGLNGILLAHVFFNAPLAARIMVQALERVPTNQQRAASQLGLSAWQTWRALEWPSLRPLLPGLAALVFSLCFTSFAIVMTLGGGPGSTTIEVAIYQALRFEFDFDRAALLAGVQLLICGALWWVVSRQSPYPQAPETDSTAMTLPARRGNSRWQLALIAGFALFLMLPVLSIILRALPWLLANATDTALPLWPATLRSLMIAVPAGGLSVLIALLVLTATSSLRPGVARGLCTTVGYLPLFIPPIVLGTGLFLLVQPHLGIHRYGLVMVSLINGLMALPFILQVLRGPFLGTPQSQQRLADQLGMRGWYRWRWLHWPRLRRPLALALGYGITLSLGDFGVIALFGAPGQPTLPMLLYQQLGSYQVAAATGTAFWLLVLITLTFSLLALQSTRRRPMGEPRA